MNENLRDWALRFSWRLNPKSIHRGFELEDDEKIMRRAIRLLMNSQIPPMIDCESKSLSTSLTYASIIAESDSDVSWEKILELCTQAIMWIPNDALRLGMLYASRSRATFVLGMYEHTLLDIQRTLNHTYIDGNKSELFIRQALSLFELNSKKKCAQVQTAIDNAARFFDMMPENDIRRAFIRSTIDTFNEYPLSDYPRMPKLHPILPLPDDNSTIVNASSAFDLKFSEEYGRHTVAVRDIAPGEILFRQKSYVSILYQEHRHLYCWYCSKRAFSGVPCHGCPYVIYCNEDCRHSAWCEYHDIECSALPAMLGIKMSATELMCVRILIKALKEVGFSVDKLREKCLKYEAVEDLIGKTHTDGMFDSRKYAPIYSATRRYPLLSTHALRSATVILVLGLSTDILGERISDYATLLENKHSAFLGALLLRHMDAIFNNVVGELETANSSVIFAQFNSLLSQFNHSCDPSVLIHTHGDFKTAIALRPIRAGDQLFVCYLSNYWKLSTEKRKSCLLDTYGFDCKCRACLEGWRSSAHRNSPQKELSTYPEEVISAYKYISEFYPEEENVYSVYYGFYTNFFH